ITYTATDSAGNVGTAERVVSVVLPESDTETEDLTPEEPVTDPVVEEPTPTEEPQPETTETDTSTSTE
ncbi:DUF5011 domain-containing protein, partial [Candidatus Wolfebacteria bacterium]|nr:DUF5011 domain-containing protein [Candidatus Wolfebacteria bacterium]